MAKKTEADFRAAIEPYLDDGEQLKHWAFGVKQPNIFLIMFLLFLAVLPGIIAVFLLTRNYVVGLTDRRFIVARFKGNLKVIEISEYPLGTVNNVESKTGPIFTHIRIEDPQQPFVAKFHRAGMPNNRDQSMAIASALANA